MKTFKKITLLFAITFISSCVELDLNPLAEGSSENWYSNEVEITMSLNNLYNIDNWYLNTEEYTDDWYTRTDLSPIVAGTISSDWNISSNLWTNCYRVISRANTLLANLDEAKNIPENRIIQYTAEARFVRAAQYSILISYFGDVVFYKEPLIDISEAFSMSRANKDKILQEIYIDFDYAIENLPLSYGDDELQRATKGAALALKARIALYMQDWNTAKDAAKSCIDLNIYSLHPSFNDLFLSKTKNSNEAIFVFPRSIELGLIYSTGTNGIVNRMRSRNVGGTSYYNPTWDLFCSFECIDGLPIDESPLFNPRKPFQNRDPRCTATIVEFGSSHLGYIYDPHPDSLNVLNLNTGMYVKNNDSRGTIQWASYNGLLFKKGIDEDWLDLITDPDFIYIRYADVLLMYAEAKIELGEIDPSVLNAINQVRARAYGVAVSAITEYPAINSNDQNYLRKKVRLERRVEFTNEGLRYMDLIRWRLAEKALTNKNYGMLDVHDLREKIVKSNLWFFPETPSIDEDGIVDFTKMYSEGLVRMLSQRSFDASRQYLWPIPSKEILINRNMNQNPGY
ncbi:RagB/SusD family nutrient uptake outer membrane protein [Petrimonas sulfuriphila]|uniref:RagB/SusD family nutrient uptake outer membrane protein n=1 Tax=Petrimonas sulfuriphila TaxID=285070 RepID=UPI00324E91CD